MVASINRHALLLGLDIGGVNVKCSSVPWAGIDQLGRAFSTKHYFPLWEKTIGDLQVKLVSIIGEHIALARQGARDIEETRVFPCASITGELSDAFPSKRDGIESITASLEAAVKAAGASCPRIAILPPKFVATGGRLMTRPEALGSHRLVAAANWYATAAWVASFAPDCLLVDSGSTTTDIIPIVGGRPSPEGNTDLDRLRSGELVYTGILRATIPSVSHVVPVRGEPVPVSFEKFAMMADAHRIIGNITEEQYDCDTADGRSTSIEDCRRRLARSVCEDASELGDGVIMDMARFLVDAQVRMVQDGIERTARRCKEGAPCVVTGLGDVALASEAAKRASMKHIKALADTIGQRASTVSSAIGVLHVLAARLKEVGLDGW